MVVKELRSNIQIWAERWKAEFVFMRRTGSQQATCLKRKGLKQGFGSTLVLLLQLWDYDHSYDVAAVFWPFQTDRCVAFCVLTRNNVSCLYYVGYWINWDVMVRFSVTSNLVKEQDGDTLFGQLQLLICQKFHCWRLVLLTMLSSAVIGT